MLKTDYTIIDRRIGSGYVYSSDDAVQSGVVRKPWGLRLEVTFNGGESFDTLPLEKVGGTWCAILC